MAGSRTRGALVVAVCLVWPLVVAALNLALSPGRPCAAGVDCASRSGTLAAAPWILLAVAPVALALVWWRRSR